MQDAWFKVAICMKPAGEVPEQGLQTKLVGFFSV